jgi:hypothetical protein
MACQIFSFYHLADIDADDEPHHLLLKETHRNASTPHISVKSLAHMRNLACPMLRWARRGP